MIKHISVLLEMQFIIFLYLPIEDDKYSDRSDRTFSNCLFTRTGNDWFKNALANYSETTHAHI